MELFDKKYVYFMWDDKLEENEAFIANYIEDLIDAVNTQDFRFKTRIHESCEDYYKGKYPFCNTVNESFSFVYYDPNYELKFAYNNGKTIESYDEELKKWVEEKEPKWWDNVKYRVKQNDKFCTNRQLAKWLAQGNGECKTEKFVSTYYAYEEKYTNNEVEDYLVRRWEDSVWHTPTLDYMGIKQDEAIIDMW
jgi:hypothetical protein